MKSFWWKLTLIFFDDLEESLIWRLNSLGIRSYAIETSLKKSFNQTLIVWLPDSEWSEKDRDVMVESLIVLEKVFHKGSLTFHWEKIDNEDWSSSWKKFWKPDPVGKKMLILPSWLKLPSIYANRIVIRLDPGSAFGTGNHPTTRLCLEALERNPPKGLKVADVGCGSGILGISALLLGADSVKSVDVDSLAVRATSENALLNNFNEMQLETSLGSIEALGNQLKGDKADLLVCNILAPVIKKLAPDFVRVTSSDSHLLISGLLVDQVMDITKFLSTLGWNLIASYTLENWSLIHLCRSSS